MPALGSTATASAASAVRSVWARSLGLRSSRRARSSLRLSPCATQAKTRSSPGAPPSSPPLTPRGPRRSPSNKWTFKVAVEDYLAAHVGSWKRADAKRVWHGPFVRYAYPVLGSMPLDDIRVEHIVAIMDACAAAGVTATGVKLRGHIEQVINAAIAKGQRNAALGNPASVKLVKATSPAMKRLSVREHHRRITIEDAPAIFRRIFELASGKSTHAAWAFAILTASRPGEALYAKWDEIDFDKKIWTCPGGPNGRMKTGKDHVVPLSSAALAVLERQAKVRVGDYVFPGRGAGKPSYVNFATAPKQAGFDAGSPHSLALDLPRLGWRHRPVRP